MNKPNIPANAGDDDFEIVESNSVEFARRGRKSIVDQKLIDILKSMPKGKTVAIRKMALDPKANTYKTDKARISSQIRTACAKANLETFRIRWSVDGVPFVEA